MQMHPSMDIPTCPKNGYFLPFSTDFEAKAHHMRHTFPAASFWLILCVVVPHTHRYHPPKFQPNVKHHDEAVVFPHLACACCLLAACLLLACCLLAKPGRSTLGTKEGYKTKTSSTSSVTLTLTRIEYLDRAGGGRNMV